MASDPKTRNNVSVLGNTDSEHAIVFVHGFGTDQSAWMSVAEPFMQHFKIVLLDNVGAGRSDPTAFVQ
ncbi:alpha/beta fold hydrolase, partial [Niveibacterium sp.]|uniref:alpha/beta fold hydrolase n=1 Tax=Niveibacterium sp. TaxID=2017444 RepID=UPI0035B04379